MQSTKRNTAGGAEHQDAGFQGVHIVVSAGNRCCSIAFQHLFGNSYQKKDKVPDLQNIGVHPII